MYVVIPLLAVVARVLYLLGALVYGRLRSRYALIIETAGTEFTALTGRDPHELERIKREITHALENPPNSERVLHAGGDIVIGDQYKQTGRNTTMVVNRTEGISQAELDAAVAELRSLVNRLKSEGFVGPDGSVADPGAVVDAVKTRAGGLAALGKAVKGGAEEALTAAVKGGVAQLVVALLAGGSG